MKTFKFTWPTICLFMDGKTLNRWVIFLFVVTGLSQKATAQSPTDWPKEWQAEMAQMDMTAIKSGILLNYSLLTQKQLDMFRHPFKAKDGSIQVAVRAADWVELYQQVRAGDFRSQRLPSVDKSFRESTAQADNKATNIPIGILNMEGNWLTVQQISDNKAAKKQGKPEKGNEYETLSIIQASVLKEDVYQRSVRFQFDPGKHFANSSTIIQQAGIDFLDGQGIQMVHLGAPASIKYEFTSPGKKTILIKLKTNRGDYTSITQINVKSLVPYPSSQEFVLEAAKTITSPTDKGARAAAAITGGTLRAILGCDGVLDKPILVVEGFDPGNRNGFDFLIANYLGSFNGSTYSGTFNVLTNSGYDLVFLNFGEARDYIQNNANVVKAAIRKLNEIKSGNGPLIVIGESAGGITARYALRKLEQEGYFPNVSHYVSFDSPHRGAHIPEGVQFLARDAVSRALVQLYSKFSSEVQPLFSIVDDGDQPAARQLIMRRADLQVGISIQPDFTALQNELAQLGYPTQSRNIALVSGSLNGAGQLNNNFNPEAQGQRLLVLGGNIGYDAIATSAISNQNMELSFLRVAANAGSFSASLPTNPDVVPGGFDRNLSDQDPSTGFRYSFIPTYSAIDSPNPINSDADMYQITAGSASPFARIYGGPFNQEHVSVIQRSAAWSELFSNEFGITNPACQTPISTYPPSPSFSAPASLCNGQGGNLTADDASGGIQGLPLEYSWRLENLSNGGITVKTGTGIFFGVNANDYSPGYYRVVIIVNYQGYPNVYGSNSAVFPINLNCPPGGRLATQEPLSDEQVVVFPNPSHTSMTINLPQTKDGSALITLVNQQSRIVYRQTVTNQTQHQIDVNDQPAGIYLLRVQEGLQQWTKKVIINH